MSSIKIDLSKFKHLKSDDKSTTLQHQDGHTITLAHGMLSKPIQGQLKALASIGKNYQTPDQADEARMQKAEGGRINETELPKSKSKEENVLRYPLREKNKQEGGTLDYTQLKKEYTEKNRPKYDEGGKVAVPQGEQDTPPPSTQEKPVGANVNGPSSMSDAINRFKNAWAEGGKIRQQPQQSPIDTVTDNYVEGGAISNSGPTMFMHANGGPANPSLSESKKSIAASHPHPQPNMMTPTGSLEQMVNAWANGGEIQRYAFGSDNTTSDKVQAPSGVDDGQQDKEQRAKAIADTERTSSQSAQTQTFFSPKQMLYNVRHSLDTKNAKAEGGVIGPNNPKLAESKKSLPKQLPSMAIENITSPGDEPGNQGGGMAKGGAVCYACGKPHFDGGGNIDDDFKNRRPMASGGNPADQEAFNNMQWPDPNAAVPPIPPQLMGKNQPQFQPPDPEKPIVGPATEKLGQWLMETDQSPLGVKPADIAATKADAMVDNLGQQQQAAQNVSDAAHQQAAVQAKPDQFSPEGLAQSGLQSELAGARNTARATGALGEQQGLALQSDIARKQDIAKQYQDTFNQLNGEREAHIRDIQQGYIDPNQYWIGDKDGNGGHSKIATAIGMILAGFNPTNRPNAAIDFLQHQMDRNIEAQKSNLSAKQNLLTANLHQFQNAKDAIDMTRIMQADVVKSQLEQAAAKAASPLAKAAAQTAAGQIDARYQPIFMQLQIRHMMQNLGNGGTSANGSTGQMLSGLDIMAPEQAKMYRSRYYAPYDAPGGKSLADREITPADRTSLMSYDKFDNAANILHQLISKSRGSIDSLNPIERNAAAQQAMVLQSLFREGTLGTVYKAGEQPLLDKAIDGQPLGLVHYFTELPKLEGLMKSNQMMKQTTLDNYGLRPPPGHPAATTTPNQYKTVKGVRYIRGPNGEAIPVK